MTGGSGAGSGSHSTVRRAIAWYLLWSAVVLVVVSLGVVLVAGVVAKGELLRDSQRTARAVADTIIAPLATQAFHDGQPAAVEALDDAMASRYRDGSLLHVKVWEDAGNGQGRILHADETQLIGRTFAMEPDEYALFGTTDAVSSISDLQKEENTLERSAGQLAEVYTGVIDDAGVPLLFEAYIPTDRLEESSQSLVGSLLPLTIGALVLLSLATLPLAISLARRVDRAQHERGRLLANAVASSDLERRRIAQELHDGVVQDLAGVGYSLSSVSRRPQVDEGTRAQVDEAIDIVLRDVAALRTLMTDIYPPDLDHRGLAEAVDDLLDQGPLDRAHVTFDVDEPLTPSPTTGRLAFRVIREALRNVVQHSGARNVTVRLGQVHQTLTFEVADDGVGFDPQGAALTDHFGLRLIRETVADAGGVLHVASEPGAGTRVFGHLPL